MSTPVLFDSASRVYPGSTTPAVDALHLDIDPGELLVLVGPSGCGKSTSLRMLAGLEDVTSGSIHVGGRDVTHLPPKDRDIAMVFQSYALYPHLTVGENMGFALKIARVSKSEIRSRVAEAAKVLDLEPLLDRKPAALSGGQRQRVAMGRAIVREPQVFLMDEPLSNLDAKLRVQMRLEIKQLQRQPRADAYQRRGGEAARNAAAGGRAQGDPRRPARAPRARRAGQCGSGARRDCHRNAGRRHAGAW